MHSTVTVIDGRRNRIELINDGALRVWGNSANFWDWTYSISIKAETKSHIFG